MHFAANKPDDLPAIGKAIRKAIAEHGPMVVTLAKAEEVRTDAQNRRYWAAIVGSLQEWLEQREGFRRDREVLHEWLKTERFGQRVEQVQGRMLMMPARTRKLSPAQFAKYVDWAEAHIIELGVPPEMIAGMSE